MGSLCCAIAAARLGVMARQNYGIEQPHKSKSALRAKISKN
jgi:hypothetical protein